MLRKPSPRRGRNTPAKRPPEHLAPDPSLLRKLGWLVFFIAVAVYANTLLHDYTLDDAIVIYDNEFTTRGLAGIPGLLKYDTFRGFFKQEGKEKLVSGGRYRPLTPVMYAVEVQLFASPKRDPNGQVVRDANGHVIYDPYEDGRPNTVKFVGHLVNVLLFALTCWLLLWLVHRLLREAGWSEAGAVWAAAGTALLFAVHPIHTEVVANIKGRDEIVALLGSLLALYGTLQAHRQRRPSWHLVAAVVFFLALMAKENAITYVAVVPLVGYFFLRKSFGASLQSMLPYLAAAVVFLAIRTSILGWDFGGTPPRELMNNPFLKLVNGQWVDFTWPEKMATIFYTLGKYVQLLVWPHPLCHDYYPRAIPLVTFANGWVLFSMALYAAMLIAAVLGFSQRKVYSFAILYYLITLSIVSNVVFPIGTNMGERFIFMPSVGFCLGVAAVLWQWQGKALYNNSWLVGLGVVLLLLAGRAVVRNPVWKDNYTLFTTDVAIQPNSAKLRTAAGGELVTRSIRPENSQRKRQMLEQGIAHLLEAVKIHPTYKNAFLLLGNAYHYLEDYETSIEYYERALQIDPQYAEARTNLAITYANAGRYYGEQRGDLQKAIEYLKKAEALNPNAYETLRLLGVAYGIGGDNEQAVKYFQRALALRPDDPDALYNLATALYRAGRSNEAEQYFQKARTIDPDIDKKRQQRQ